MDWNDTAEQSVFRNQIRSVIDAELPKRYKEGKGPPERTWEFDRKDPDFDAQKAASDWHLSLSRHGWIAPQWPVEYGGAGLSAMEQFILNQELGEPFRLDAMKKPVSVAGINHSDMQN